MWQWEYILSWVYNNLPRDTVRRKRVLGFRRFVGAEIPCAVIGVSNQTIVERDIFISHIGFTKVQV